MPPLYTFRMRSRVFRWYARLREVEAKLETGTGEREDLLDELDELDRVTHRIAVPPSYADELYALRNNIYAVESACWRSGHGRRKGRLTDRSVARRGRLVLSSFSPVPRMHVALGWSVRPMRRGL